MNVEISGQPMEIAIGPPLFQACEKVVKHPDKMEIAENEIAKLEKPDQLLSILVYTPVMPAGAHRRKSGPRRGVLRLLYLMTCFKSKTKRACLQSLNIFTLLLPVF